MLLFMLLAALLTIICIAIIWPTLNRNHLFNEVDLRQENLNIAHQRLEEFAHPDVSDNFYSTEIEAALLDDLQGPDYDIEWKKPRSFSSLVLILAVLPISAIAAYLVLGNTHWQDQKTSALQSQIETDPADRIHEILSGIEDALAKNPDSVDGWTLAGKTYMSMGRYAEAERAYSRVNQLSANNPDVLVAWANASLMTNSGQFTEDISERVRMALELNPKHQKALWLAGIGAQSQGEHETAIRYLRELRPMLNDDTDAARQVDSLISRFSHEQTTQ